MGLTEAIVAPITAAGGAVALVRVSGEGALQVARTVFDGCLDKPRTAIYGHYTTGDDGLAVLFEEGHSYTGQESVELSLHGSHASVQALVEACVIAGARLAEPGEFTYRAFMNGRIDLTQAEGVNDTVRALTDAQLRQANLLREGGLRDRVRSLRESLVSVLIAVEASTDFSEEIGDLDRGASLARLRPVAAELDRLIGTAAMAQAIRYGQSLAIVGRPNVGKSSLFNAVLQTERSIVTEVAGTTRDTVSEVVAVNGVPVRLLDTAGLREAVDTVEQIGVQRSLDALENADHVWFVFDSYEGWTPADQALLEAIGRPCTIVENKCDLVAGARSKLAAVRVSALTGEGVPLLLESLAQALHSEVDPIVNSRHAPLLGDARDAVSEACSALDSDIPDDVAAVGLRTAIRALGEVTGETTPPDVIERVFHDFCIGK